MDLAATRTDVLHLELGEVDAGTPPWAVEAADRAARDGLTRYTPNRGLPELRESVRAKLAHVNDLHVDDEQIVVTAGANGGILEALAVVTEPGDRVLVPDPGFPNFRLASAIVGAQAVGYPLDERSGWAPDLDRLESAAAEPRTRALVVNTPGNPTGAVLSDADAARLLDLAERHDLWVIADEVYDELAFDGRSRSLGALAPERVIAVFSMSKTHGMSGWRVGYVAAPREVASAIATVQEPIVSCACSIAQKAAEAALTGSQEHVTRLRSDLARRERLARERLERAGLRTPRAFGACYLLTDVSSCTRDATALAHRLVLDHGVAVAPGPTFGTRATGFVRLSIGASDADVAEGVERLIRGCREVGHG